MATVERRIGDLTVCIDRDGCISSGNCIKVAPSLFEFDAESVASFAAGADAVGPERIVEACQVCPVEALEVTDSSGNRIVP
ncbi:MAG: ferredoxin [Candidatus Eiseniibacteriota bacterium]